MVELVAKSPCAGMLPLTVGAVELVEGPMMPMCVLMPYDNQTDALGAAVGNTLGLALPEVNKATIKEDVSIRWFGRGQYLLRGAAPDAALALSAAITDQSDAWAVVRLSGKKAEDVLARLVPVDLRIKAFPEKSSIRSDLMHMMASITRVGPDEFEIMAFRSMAQTLVHDLQAAMEAVDARG